MATIHQLESGKWLARVRRVGFEPQSLVHPSKIEALKWASGIELAMKQGTFKSTRDASKVTLTEAWDRYLKEITPLKKGALRETQRIRLLQRTALAKRTLASVRGLDLAAYRDKRLKQVSPRTVQVEMATISHLYTICRTEWGMESLDNPLRAVRYPRVNNARERRLAKDEEQALRSRLCPKMNAAMTLALETGMRRGEIAALRWDQVGAQVITLRDTKNGHQRHVPLSSAARALLQSLPRTDQGLVIGLADDVISQRFKRACTAEAIVDLHFHDLRHEATSRLFEKGLIEMEVASVTGLRSLAMLKRYTHISAEHLARRLG